MSIKSTSFDQKFIQDTMWNYLAFGLMALAGIILNFFLAWKMGFEALGIFNQIYAIYVVLGQLAAFGIQDSTQKYIAEHSNNENRCRQIGQTAFWLSLVIGSLIAIIIYTLNETIALITESVNVGRGVAIIAPAICLFSMNKILMGILNGARRIKAFSIVQSLRVIVILAVCMAVALAKMPAYMLAFGFLVAEIFILPILIYLTQCWQWPFKKTDGLYWLNKHLNFGAKALSGGFLAESYIRVDILMLAIFVSDLNVGIYSFAALFIEGLFQVPVVIRTVSNPVLVKLLVTNRPEEIVKLVRRVAPLSTGIYMATAVAILLAFPLLSNFYPSEFVNVAREVMLILSLGLLFYSAFIPFDFILLQSGMPGRQSILFTVNIILNIILNTILIPKFGLWGAAFATAISFVVSTITLNLASGIWLGFRKSLIFSPQKDD